MTAKWYDIVSSDLYKNATPEEQSQVKERYWTNVVMKSGTLDTLPLQEKKIVRSRFFNPETSYSNTGASEVSSEPLFPEEIAEQKRVERRQELYKQDPEWMSLRNPDVVSQLEPSELISIMKQSQPNWKENLKQVAAGVAESGGRRVGDTRPPRDIALDELKRRGFQENAIILALEGQSPSYSGAVLENAPENVLGTLGGIGGMALFQSPAGQAFGSASGSAIGGATGKGLQDIYYTATDDIRAPKNMAEAIKRVEGAAVRQGAYDVVGQGINLGLKTGYRGLIDPLLPGSTKIQTKAGDYMPIEDAGMIVEKSKQYGIPVNTGNISMKPGLQSATAFASRTPFSENKMAKRAYQGVKGVQAMENDIRGRFVGDLSKTKGADLAGLLDESLAEKSKMWGGYEEEIWSGWKSKVENATKNAAKTSFEYRDFPTVDAQGNPIVKKIPIRQITAVDPKYSVNIKPIKQDSIDKLNKILELNPSGDINKSSELLGYKENAGSILRWFSDHPEEALPLGKAQELRSLLLKVRDQFANDKNVAIGNMKNIIGTLTDEMEKTAKNFGGDVYVEWKFNRAFTKMKHEKLENEMLKSVVNKIETDPDAMAQVMFKANTPVKVRELRKLMGAERWQKAQATVIDKILKESSGNIPEYGDSVVIGQRLADNLTKYGDTLSASLSKEQFNALYELARVASSSQSTSQRLGIGIGALQSGPMSRATLGRMNKAVAIALTVPGLVAEWVAVNPGLVNRIAKAGDIRDDLASKTLLGDMFEATGGKKFSQKSIGVLNKTPSHLWASTSIRLFADYLKYKKTSELSMEEQYKMLAGD